jgi:hypothetical protein
MTSEYAKVVVLWLICGLSSSIEAFAQEYKNAVTISNSIRINQRIYFLCGSEKVIEDKNILAYTTINDCQRTHISGYSLYQSIPESGKLILCVFSEIFQNKYWTLTMSKFGDDVFCQILSKEDRKYFISNSLIKHIVNLPTLGLFVNTPCAKNGMCYCLL